MFWLLKCHVELLYLMVSSANSRAECRFPLCLCRKPGHDWQHRVSQHLDISSLSDCLSASVTLLSGVSMCVFSFCLEFVNLSSINNWIHLLIQTKRNKTRMSKCLIFNEHVVRLMHIYLLATERVGLRLAETIFFLC